MANPNTFGSDYERGYQQALADVLFGLETGVVTSEALREKLWLLRKPNQRPVHEAQ